jgi:hypothetical protein
MVWRARVSTESAVFTARFGMREWFEIEDGFSVEDICLSSERDTEYYINVTHDEGRAPAKILKKRLAPKGTIQSLQLGSLPDLDLWRWTNCPDTFLVKGEGEMRVVNRNLSVKESVSESPVLYRLDGANGYLYGIEHCLLTKRNHNLEFVRRYQSAPSFGLFEPERYHGISFQTDTALVVLGDDQQAFYNLSNNKFSRKIRVGRVIPSKHDGKWYCFDYRREEGILRLRDITRDIRTKLEWREIFNPNAGEKAMEKHLMWFMEDYNFVYRSKEWEVSQGVAW